mmetsp:Transcript_6338/g.25675  ORF Transcript_6338/g.25675 Transcript_6338/m.25675 type:complete len:204 (+) Transcript_6338:1095-1706(+)
MCFLSLLVSCVGGRGCPVPIPPPIACIASRSPPFASLVLSNDVVAASVHSSHPCSGTSFSPPASSAERYASSVATSESESWNLSFMRSTTTRVAAASSPCAARRASSLCSASAASATTASYAPVSTASRCVSVCGFLSLKRTKSLFCAARNCRARSLSVASEPLRAKRSAWCASTAAKKSCNGNASPKETENGSSTSASSVSR